MALGAAGATAAHARPRLGFDRQPASGIRFGTQTNAYAINSQDFATFLAALENARAIGFEGFETGYRNVEHQFLSPAEARAGIAATGLTFFGIHIFLKHELYDSKTLLAPRPLYEKVALGGRSLGAQTLVLSGAAAEDTGQLNAKVEALNQAGRFCAATGLGLAYHNEEPESGSRLGELDVLYSETDPASVAFLFDVGHLFNLDGDVVGFLRKHHRRIAGLHLRDYQDHRQVVLGTGSLPLLAIASTLERLHWQGWVETEEERLDGVKHGEAYLRPAFLAMKGAFRP